MSEKPLNDELPYKTHNTIVFALKAHELVRLIRFSFI